ncbi:hypothetical protein BDV96DRAFT_650908 [Lophiotrema nucula]|uniref:WD40-repeat-containing domain protein n=1 Tax=Lophiotrema nucula TaxID=690887 RepID=A0A6A5YTB7_9PLEO|nr:hypothetical protein BDV96DRAFT_650908 [Lophiotrema nucula]
MAKRNLFIVTPRAALLHISPDIRRLFACGPDDGIVNAKPANDNSGLIAVADSHLVLLHDLSRGTEKEYKLKSGSGEPRLLLFSPTSSILYFTTTLNPAIQAYSIPTAELLPPLHAHPSPPNILVICPDGSDLLSASPTPPTVFIQDLRVIGGASVQFQPSTRSPAACAAFHPHSACFFAIGFTDGTVAVYRFAKPSLQPLATVITDDNGLARPKELGSVKRLHKASMRGVLAIDFIAGYHARIVSYVSGPATSLAVTSHGPIQTFGRKQRDVVIGGDAGGDDEARLYEGLETLVAVGTQAGKVLVFNVLGLLVQEVIIDLPVIGVEWVGDMNEPSQLRSRRTTPTSPLRPVADNLLREFELAQQEEDGTVRRSPRISSDKPLDWLPRAPTDMLSQTPQPAKWTMKSPRKSFPRPRIVTETFKSPTAPASRTTSLITPTSKPESPNPASPATPVGQFKSVDVPLMSGALGPASVSGSDSEISDIDDEIVSDIWSDPQSQPQASFHIKSPQSSGALQPIDPSPIHDSPESSIYSTLKSPPNFPRRRTWRIRKSRVNVDGGQSPVRTRPRSPRKRSKGDDGMYSIERGRRVQKIDGMSGASLQEQNERLVMEMQALQQEFKAFKEAMLASKL